jgi:fibronectin-binding autotransporter adhesin
MHLQIPGFLAASFALAIVHSAGAQTWTGAVNGNWSNAGNWTGGVPASGSNTVLTFGTSINPVMSNDIANPFLLNEMIFQAGGNAYSLTGGGALNFVSSSGAALPSIAMNANAGQIIFNPVTLTNNLSITGTGTGTFTFANNNISGAGSLTMAGAGTLQLGSSVLNNGGLFVTSGTILMGGSGSIQAGESVTASGTGTFNPGSVSNTSGTALNTLSVSGGGKFVATSAGNYFMNKLVMAAGTVDLSGATNYALHISGTGAALATNTSAVGAVWIGPTGSGNSASLSNDTGAPLNIAVNGGGPGLTGIDLDCGLALTGGGFVKTGPGLMRLTNPNSTAPITVQGGFLRVDDASSNGGVGAFGTGALTLNGAFLAYGGPSGTTTTKPIALGANGGGIGVLSAGATWTVGGVISQSAAGSGLNVNGFAQTGTPTTIVVTGNNTFTQLILVEDLATLQVPAIPSEGSGATGTTASPLGQSNNAPGNLILGDGGNGGTVPNGRGTLMFAPPTGGTFSTDRGVTVISQYANNGGGAVGVGAATSLTMTGQITGGGALVKTGVGTLTLTNTSNNFGGGLYVENGTLNLGVAGAVGSVLPANCNVTVAPTVSGAVPILQLGFTSGTNSTAPLGTLTLNNGTFSIPAGAANFWLNQIVVGAAGGTVNMTSSTGIEFTGTNPGATINGIANWTAGFFENGAAAPATISVAANATLTSSAYLYGPSSSTPFVVTGAGTLHVIAAPYANAVNNMVVGNGGTTAQGRVQVDDLSVNASDGASVLGYAGRSGYFTLNGGTLAYSGVNQTTSFPITSVLTNSTIEITNQSTTLTLTAAIAGAAGQYNITKTGPGTLSISGATSATYTGYRVAAGTLVVGAGGVLAASNSVTVLQGGTFQVGFSSGTNGAGPASLTLDGGTMRIPTGNPIYFLNSLGVTPNGGTIDLGGSTAALQFGNGAVPTITVSGNTTWSGTTATLVNNTFAQMTLSIAPPATVTDFIPLSTPHNQLLPQSTFQVAGGGTLYVKSLSNTFLNIMTVSQGRVKVDDLSVNSSNGTVLGLNGSGDFVLAGGTLAYAGPNQSSPFFFSLGAGGGTIEVSNPATTLTLTSFIPGSDSYPLTKSGPGTLILSNTSNPYYGGITVNGGTLAVGNDNQLGGAPVTINPAGNVIYVGNTSTSRTFNMNNGTLGIVVGATLSTSGAINGGNLAGPGTFSVSGALSGVTSAISAVIQDNGATFTNFVNGGSLTVANGVLYNTTAFNRFTNQGSGSITLGVNSSVTVSDFQSYGTLTLNPAAVGSGPPTLLSNTGSSPLYFNGGSRTFIGSPATASQNVAGVNLGGRNLVIAGGLFVNNGFVADSTGTPGSVIVDFGALYKGAGTNFVNVITQNGGKVQAGNSPGSMGFGRFVFGPGGINNYVFAIDDATGAAGPSPDALGHVSGWGLVKAVKQQFGPTTSNGDFVWTATPSDKLLFAIDTLINPTTVGTDVPGMMANFDPNRPYAWPAVRWAGTYSGPTHVAMMDAATSFDTSGFRNPVAGTFGWNLDPVGQSLSLIYTPSAVPEPGTLALFGLAGAGLACWRRRG